MMKPDQPFVVINPLTLVFALITMGTPNSGRRIAAANSVSCFGAVARALVKSRLSIAW